MDLSARAQHAVLKLACTMADLASEQNILSHGPAKEPQHPLRGVV